MWTCVQELTAVTTVGQGAGYLDAMEQLFIGGIGKMPVEWMPGRIIVHVHPMSLSMFIWLASKKNRVVYAFTSQTRIPIGSNFYLCTQWVYVFTPKHVYPYGGNLQTRKMHLGWAYVFTPKHVYPYGCNFQT